MWIKKETRWKEGTFESLEWPSRLLWPLKKMLRVEGLDGTQGWWCLWLYFELAAKYNQQVKSPLTINVLVLDLFDPVNALCSNRRLIKRKDFKMVTVSASVCLDRRMWQSKQNKKPSWHPSKLILRHLIKKLPLRFRIVTITKQSLIIWLNLSCQFKKYEAESILIFCSKNPVHDLVLCYCSLQQTAMKTEVLSIDPWGLDGIPSLFWSLCVLRLKEQLGRY